MIVRAQSRRKKSEDVTKLAEISWTIGMKANKKHYLFAAITTVRQDSPFQPELSACLLPIQPKALVNQIELGL